MVDALVWSWTPLSLVNIVDPMQSGTMSHTSVAVRLGAPAMNIFPLNIVYLQTAIKMQSVDNALVLIVLHVTCDMF